MSCPTQGGLDCSECKVTEKENWRNKYTVRHMLGRNCFIWNSTTMKYRKDNRRKKERKTRSAVIDDIKKRCCYDACEPHVQIVRSLTCRKAKEYKEINIYKQSKITDRFLFFINMFYAIFNNSQCSNS